MAESELYWFQQNNWDFASYFTKFYQLVSKASWDTVATLSALLARLYIELKHICIIWDLSNEYNSLVDILKTMDNIIHTLATELGGSFCSTLYQT
jgi:coenzyme F420-reducing hydrogenase delta subunit